MQRAKVMQRPWKPQPITDSVIEQLPPSGYRRTERDARYNTHRWHKASARFREAHPLCAECLKAGLYVPTQVVDHIIPVPICDDFWDESNWQPLCKKCNAAKGNRDKKIIQRYKAQHVDNQ